MPDVALAAGVGAGFFWAVLLIRAAWRAWRRGQERRAARNAVAAILTARRNGRRRG